MAIELYGMVNETHGMKHLSKAKELQESKMRHSWREASKKATQWIALGRDERREGEREGKRECRWWYMKWVATSVNFVVLHAFDVAVIHAVPYFTLFYTISNWKCYTSLLKWNSPSLSMARIHFSLEQIRFLLGSRYNCMSTHEQIYLNFGSIVATHEYEQMSSYVSADLLLLVVLCSSRRFKHFWYKSLDYAIR